MMSNGAPTRLLSRAAVCARTGLSYSTIWRREREGDFPARRQISRNRVGWVEAELERWLESRARVTSAGEAGGNNLTGQDEDQG